MIRTRITHLLSSIFRYYSPFDFPEEFFLQNESAQSPLFTSSMSIRSPDTLTQLKRPFMV